MSFTDYPVARERMVRNEVFARGVHDRRVLRAMLSVPRHLFAGDDAGPEAYSSHAVPIGHSQTMSQPYMVAYLSERLGLTGEETVLEIGTGSGYQAAVLSHLAKHVYTVERIWELAERARAVLDRIGITSVSLRVGDGSEGWPEQAPFDRILLTAAASEVPNHLLMQLRDGGFMLGPVTGAGGDQSIVRLERAGDAFHLERLAGCSFVPMVRETNGSGIAHP